jgi:hypothetical protein
MAPLPIIFIARKCYRHGAECASLTNAVTSTRVCWSPAVLVAMFADIHANQAAFWYGSLHFARTIAGRPQRSEKRRVCVGCLAVFLFHGRPSVRRKRDDVWHAPAPLARSGSPTRVEARLSAVAPGNRFALSRDRTGVAISDGGSSCVRVEPFQPSEADKPIRASEAGPVHDRSKAALQQGAHQIDRLAGASGANLFADRSGRY